MSNADYVTPYDWMLLNSELGRTLKGMVTAYFKAIPQYFADETEEDHEIPHSDQSVSCLNYISLS